MTTAQCIDKVIQPYKKFRSMSIVHIGSDGSLDGGEIETRERSRCEVELQCDTLHCIIHYCDTMH